MSDRKRVVVTGACGLIAGQMLPALRKHYDLILLDVRTTDSEGNEIAGVRVADLLNRDRDAYRRYFRDAYAVVHSGFVRPQDPSQRFFAELANVEMAYNVYQVSWDENVRRVISISSNHAADYYESLILDGKWDFVNPDDRALSDNYYGWAKESYEHLGFVFAVGKHNGSPLENVQIRIGGPRETDVARCPKGDLRCMRRALGVYLSQRDFDQLILKSIEAPDIRDEFGVPFQIFYGISANSRAFWSIANARKIVGYEPEDNSEIRFRDVIAEHITASLRQDITPLFEPLQVKGKTLPNRIVMPPMVGMRPITSPEGIEWYGRHASGGVGLVIVEATSVNRFGTELTAQTLKPLVEAIHRGGALAAIQLFPITFGRKMAPDELSQDEIKDTIAGYEKAARICLQAGFDGIEPHGAHGYLLNQFFSPEQNERMDDYGGSLENRMRLAVQIVDAVRPICGDNMLLLYRHTPVGKGYGIQESQVLAERLVGAGVDILDISPSSIDAPGDRAAPFKGFGVPVIAVNELDKAERALEVLNQGRADLVAVARGLIADPDWPIKVREGHFDEIVECIRCDVKCFGNLRKGIPIECTQWE
ncbi:MAG: NAD-dependent epimerase/dehydratase family protein [Anaerolineae bacterium]|nr:NAD-dependent epimerase/dehydratase family protein [Anaerolineae bacterium]